MTTLSAEEIRELAETRVGFRRHALTYVLVNVFLVGIWAFTSRGESYWPLWVHLGWGIGLAVHAYQGYGPRPRPDAVAREEEKLRAKYGR